MPHSPTVEQDLFLLDCPTYTHYVDTFVTRNDLRYLRNLELCRILVELGYRSSAEIYKPDEFEKRKVIAYESVFPAKKAAIIFSRNLKSSDPLLVELAQRESLNAQKIVSTIIFVKSKNRQGFDITGYIDFEDSLRRAQNDAGVDWKGVFAGKVLLQPRRTDLSYIDWHKGHVYYNESENYRVLHDVENGLIFMHRGDHKKICVDSTRELYADNCTRTICFSEIYGYVTLYDHAVRKKN